MQKGIYLDKALQADNVFVKSEVKSLAEIAHMETRKGLECVVISEGKIVNVVCISIISKNYVNIQLNKLTTK